MTVRVVQVSFHADAGRRSAETLLSVWPTLPAVALAASRAGVTVTVVQRAHRDEIVVRQGVDFHFVNDVARAADRVIERVHALAPDVIHVQGLNDPRGVRQLFRRVPGVPLLVQDHGAEVPTGWRAHAWRWAHRSLAGVTFTAREQASPWKRAKVLRADLPVFEVLESSSEFTVGDRREAQRRTQMFGDPCVLWTGRLDANKDPLTMLAAFEWAAVRLPAARLWCCYGDAPLLDAVQRRIAASAVLTERVVLLGTRPHEELEHRFRAADFFVQMSHRESSGYSLIEALACGTTPLVTDISSARRIVGEAGSLSPVGDARSLAEAMVTWASRDASSLRAAARAQFDAALSFDVVGRQLRHAYESVRTEP